MLRQRTDPRAKLNVDRFATRVESWEPILTVEQVSERLQLKPSTVYELTRRRNKHPLPVLRAGKFLRFRWSQIEAWLAGE